jgi:UDP-glucose 4-epimerase
MTAFVTGSTGFLGKNLVGRLLEKGEDVVTFGKTTRMFPPYEATHYCCDLSAPIDGVSDNLFAKACRDYKPDVIFHLAGNPLSKLNNDKPHDIIYDNIVSTQKVLHHAPQGCRVILASTVIVYGDWLYDLPWDDSLLSYRPYKESDKTEPTSVYGMTKRAAESLVSIYTSMSKVSGVSLRMCATVGPNLTHGVIKDFVRKLQSSSKYLDVLGDEPGSKKPYCHVDDVIEAFVLMSKSNAVGEFNVLPDNTITIKEVAAAVMEGCGINKPINWLGEGANWKGDNKIIDVGNEKLKSTGWQPKFPDSYDVIVDMVKRISQ